MADKKSVTEERRAAAIRGRQTRVLANYYLEEALKKINLEGLSQEEKQRVIEEEKKKALKKAQDIRKEDIRKFYEDLGLATKIAQERQEEIERQKAAKKAVKQRQILGDGQDSAADKTVAASVSQGQAPTAPNNTSDNNISNTAQKNPLLSSLMGGAATFIGTAAVSMTIRMGMTALLTGAAASVFGSAALLIVPLVVPVLAAVGTKVIMNKMAGKKWNAGMGVNSWQGALFWAGAAAGTITGGMIQADILGPTLAESFNQLSSPEGIAPAAAAELPDPDVGTNIETGADAGDGATTDDANVLDGAAAGLSEEGIAAIQSVLGTEAKGAELNELLNNLSPSEAQQIKDHAFHLFNGLGGEEMNRELAVQLLQVSAENGNIQAQADLAYAQYHGLGGVEADQEAAIAKMHELRGNPVADRFLTDLGLLGNGDTPEPPASAGNPLEANYDPDSDTNTNTNTDSDEKIKDPDEEIKDPDEEIKDPDEEIEDPDEEIEDHYKNGEVFNINGEILTVRYNDEDGSFSVFTQDGADVTDSHPQSARLMAVVAQFMMEDLAAGQVNANTFDPSENQSGAGNEVFDSGNQEIIEGENLISEFSRSEIEWLNRHFRDMPPGHSEVIEFKGNTYQVTVGRADFVGDAYNRIDLKAAEGAQPAQDITEGFREHDVNSRIGNFDRQISDRVYNSPNRFGR